MATIYERRECASDQGAARYHIKLRRGVLKKKYLTPVEVGRNDRFLSTEATLGIFFSLAHV